MDISIGSPGGLNSPFSPKSRHSVTSKRTSLLSNFRTQSKLKVSGRLNQNTQTILKTTSNTVETYGLPLPVLVTETLTFADATAQISARLSPGGWGWVVCGRRLLVWPYREPRPSRGPPTAPGTPSQSPSVTCYELTLPQTDLDHKADLVCVYTTEGNQVPSCIGVSPEGTIRYWASVGHEGSYWDEEVDLHGQECDTLREARPTSGCVLATTTCTVVYIQPTISGGFHAVTAKTLTGSGGWLGGIGRKVSSLFFSAMPSSHSSETQLVGLASLGGSSYEDLSQCTSPGGSPSPPGCVCVVAGLRVQLWRVGGGGGGGGGGSGGGGSEGLVAEADLQRTLQDAFLHSHIFPQSDPGLLNVTILDIQPWNEGLLLLVSAFNTMRMPQIKYALVHMCVEEQGGLGQLLGVVALTVGGQNSIGDGPLGLLSTPTHAFLYQRNKIVVVSSITPNDKPDVLEFNTNGDQILGAGLCYGVPLFFSKSHGVLSIAPNDSPLNDTSLLDSPMASPRPSEAFDGHLSLYELDPRAVGSSGAPASEQLKAAFLHHVRKEHAASRSILVSLFPMKHQDGDETPDVDSLLDRTLLIIATDLVNDIPASDPRWNQSGAGGGAALGSSGSLQIAPQLQDKRRALSLLLDFCRVAGLWARLGGATPPQHTGPPAPTVLLLRELAEKITAAVALRTLQQQPQHQHVVDTVIQQVMSSSSLEEEENVMCGSALSPSDLFYKRVTGVGRALVAACNWCRDQDQAGCATPTLSQLIIKVNRVILAVIQEVFKYRHQQTDYYSVSPSAQSLRLEHTTWTSSPRVGGLLDALRAQYTLSVTRARRAAPELKGELRAQSAALGGVILQAAGERAQAFPSNTKRKQLAMKDYTQMRSEIIQPFVDDEEYEHGTSLAEKYHDFDMLVLICEKSNNREKLFHYMDKYESLGFQEVAFQWFMSKGRGGQAALLRAFPHHSGPLSRWLASQSVSASMASGPALSEDEDEEDQGGGGEGIEGAVEGSQILWIHELRNGRWMKGATTLLQLAQMEQESVHRMNIQASLAKLSALAAESVTGGEGVVTAAEQRLLLKDYHNLPPAILAHHGLTEDTLRVMEPRDIVDMYITYPGSSLTEYDYVKALELCSLIPGDVPDIQTARCEVAELRRRVWCAILLTDNWKDQDVDSPLNTVQNKTFFRVVDAVHLFDCNLDDYLIPLDDLLASQELSELVEDKVFQYIMKFGYEHVYRSQNENMVVGD